MRPTGLEPATGSLPPGFGPGASASWATTARLMVPSEGFEPSHSHGLNVPPLPVGVRRHGAPGGTRTPSGPVRSRVLYPIEVRAHVLCEMETREGFEPPMIMTGLQPAPFNQTRAPRHKNPGSDLNRRDEPEKLASLATR